MSKLTLFADEGNWYKGNLHLHTTFSDGAMSPEKAVDVYRNAGYSFLAVTDHRVYGIYDNLQTDGFILFGGVELDLILTEARGFCHHVIFVAQPEKTPFFHGQNLGELCDQMDMQEIIDYMNTRGHIAIYAHPRWSHVAMDEYINIKGCIGLEVYNNLCERLFGCGESISYYEHRLWKGEKCFCFASDDSHEEHHCLGGYIVVKAKSLKHQDIIDSIKAGSFYASEGGPEIFDFYFENNIAHISCSPCSQIAFFSDGFFGNNHCADEILLTEASYDTAAAIRKTTYVYAMCTDEKGRRSWTQPIKVRDYI